MSAPRLVQLVQDLEWLGCELEHYGKKHAHEGFPESGPTWAEFLAKRRGVLYTADKVEHELKNAVRFNPTELVGLDFPLEAALDSVAMLLNTVEEIKQAAETSVHELPARVREFTRMIQTYLNTIG